LLWKNPLVDFSGQWHKILDAGLNPMPAWHSIPVWFGGHADRVLERAARLGDGWMPNYRTPADARPALEKIDEYLALAGRTRIQQGAAESMGFGLEARIPYGAGKPDDWQSLINGWQNLGVSHISFNTMGVGFNSASEHIQAIQSIAQAVGV
jgi:hypothetical protein